MSAALGTANNPLRVAIIGSGPSGFYAADYFQKQKDLVVHIDMLDRLPTPFGLVRGGVAPDHAKIKSVTKVYDKIALDPNFRFYGNVELGKDVTHADLAKYYHQIIYAVGAQTDRRMGIPGEDLAGSHAATEFVAWYNGHPDYRHLKFDLTQERAAVIGVGNVAMDVARILASSYEELRKTDIADYALEELKKSNVREIYVIGRRGPAQSAFTNPEIKEIGELEEAEAVAYAEEVTLDPLSRAALDESKDNAAEKNVEILMRYAQTKPQGKKKRLYMRFLLSPEEITGPGRVEHLKLVRNELYASQDGSLRPRATDKREALDVGLVFRSIGYKGLPLADVPFDDKAGIISNQQGRVFDAAKEKIVEGEYVVGWIKRGPSGVIGTNKPDSQDTVNLMLEDLAKGKALNPGQAGRESFERLLNDRKINYVTYQDWQVLDRLEIERGKALDRPRVKFCTVAEMLEALKKHKATS
jgi:ferredoxin--NADP+ reductase